MEEVKQLIEEREIQYPENLLKAREICEKAVEAGGDQVNTATVLLTEILFWLGDYTADKAEKEKFFSAGVEYGKKAVELEPESVAANLWFASNMGNHAVERGIMSALFYLGPIEKHGKKAMELEEGFFHAAPLRLMGRFYQQAPGWPVGPGDGKKALQCLERAMELSPDFGFNHTYLADLHLSNGKKDEARKLLEEAEALPPRPNFQRLNEKIQGEIDALKAKL